MTRWLRTAVTAAIVGSVAGCSTTLRIPDLDDPRAATTTINYTSVRSEARRFPDYTAIDRKILKKRPAK